MRILLLDIETAPHKAMVWNLRDKNPIPLERLMEPGYTLCWAAKWLGEKEVMFSSVQNRGVKAMLRRIHALLDKADAVIHFNGTSFDVPTLNGEFVKHGMKPPSPYKQIDLLRTCQKTFRLASNKLDYVLRYFGLGQKVHHKGMDLWIGCMHGVAEDWATMQRYNEGDVTELEKLYLHVRSWVRSHPNYAVFNPDTEHQCPTCGNANVQRRGTARALVNTYQRYQCKDCGTWSRTGMTMTTYEERKMILRPVV